MQLDPKHIPTPAINDRLSSSFHVSPWAELVWVLTLSFHHSSVSLFFFSFYRLLENEKLLLVLADRENFFVFLEPLTALDSAIRRGKYIKGLNRKKLGQNVLISFDEAKRILAVCASTKVLSALLADLGRF